MRRLLPLAGLLAFAAAALLPAQSALAQKDMELMKVSGKLTNDDPADKVKTDSKCNIHKLKLESGKTYRIELKSKDFDSFLRLEDADGTQVAFDDDGGGFPHARLVYAAKKNGEYRIIVTSFDGKVGDYTLAVNHASKLDLLEGNIGKIHTLPANEKKALLDEVKKHFADRGKDLAASDANLAFKLALKLEQTKDAAAVDTYQDLGKLLEASSDAKVANMAKMFEGAARRLKLPGNAMMIKGNKLDGKPFDWGAYKGKVVLVDFWATWCGPCVAEMPNIKKMYELYHDRGFEVVGISLDSDKDKPAKFMEKHNLPWTCVFNEKGADSLADYYGIFFIPTVMLVDRDGKVVSMNARGPELGKQLEKLIGAAEKDKK